MGWMGAQEQWRQEPLEVSCELVAHCHPVPYFTPCLDAWGFVGDAGEKAYLGG
jgi:hypothetical protein